MISGALADPDLIDFASGAGEKSIFLTYLLVPGKTLADLRLLGADSRTSYSGVLATAEAIPEASTAGAVFGAAVAGLGIYVQIRRRRSAA